jgi:hypothetical protein
MGAGVTVLNRTEEWTAGTACMAGETEVVCGEQAEIKSINATTIVVILGEDCFVGKERLLSMT